MINRYKINISIIILIQYIPLIELIFAQLRHLDMRNQRVILILYHIRH